MATSITIRVQRFGLQGHSLGLKAWGSGLRVKGCGFEGVKSAKAMQNVL